MSGTMFRGFFLIALLVFASGSAARAADSAELVRSLETAYAQWRAAMVAGNYAAWEAATATHRQAQVRNQFLSERRPFPGTLFQVPVAPPALDGLKLLQAKRNGRTAKATYFGRVDFGVGGEPTDNLYVVSFVQEGPRWRFDAADFVSLAALPDVRAEIQRGDLSYVEETADFHPTGEVPPVPAPVGPAKYIAKVYVYAPGRDVRVQVNKISHHRVVNDRSAEVVIGGAKDGPNEVQWAIRRLEGGTGTEPMTIRVYLFSEVEGVKPIKAFEYQLAEGEKPMEFGTRHFQVDAATVQRLMGR